MLSKVACICCHLLTFFKIFFFRKILSGTLSECQTIPDLALRLLIKTKIQTKKNFLALYLSDVVFSLLINVKMPTIVGILTFMSRTNFMLS